jgi:protein gp37
VADQRGGGIGWCDETWNPVRGCLRVSPGCENCYAEAVAARFCGEGQPYEGLIKIRKDGSRRWSGDVVAVPSHMMDPMKWKRPRRIFVNSMSDLFHPGLDNEDILAVFAVMACSPQHTFQVLTKRPQEMLEWFDWFRNHVLEAAMDGETIDEARIAVLADALGNMIVGETSHKDYDGSDEAALIKGKLEELYIKEWDTPSGGTAWQHRLPWPLPNVWLGVSTENQQYADERIPLLLQAPAAKHFISAEPLLGPVDVSKYLRLKTESVAPLSWVITPPIDWVIAGCESGPNARLADPKWYRSLRDQCAAASTPYFLKQARWDGVWIRNDGPHSKLKRGSIVEAPTLEGVEHLEFPA